MALPRLTPPPAREEPEEEPEEGEDAPPPPPPDAAIVEDWTPGRGGPLGSGAGAMEAAAARLPGLARIELLAVCAVCSHPTLWELDGRRLCTACAPLTAEDHAAGLAAGDAAYRGGRVLAAPGVVEQWIRQEELRESFRRPDWKPKKRRRRDDD